MLQKLGTIILSAIISLVGHFGVQAPVQNFGASDTQLSDTIGTLRTNVNVLNHQVIDSTSTDPGHKHSTSTIMGTFGVPSGGTGNSSLTAYSVLTGGTNSTSSLQQVSGVGTSGQVLTSNGSATLPTWQNGAGAIGLFGDGSDGVGTISATTSLTKDTYYSSLTVATSVTLFPAGYRVFVNGNAVINGFLSATGTAGTVGAPCADGGATPGGGGGGAALPSGTLYGSIVGSSGGAGGAGASGVAVAGATGTIQKVALYASSSVAGGAGGTGAGTRGAAGGSATTASASTTIHDISTAFWLRDIVNYSSYASSTAQLRTGASSGGGGGGAGGSNANGCGGAGGGSGSPGGIIWLVARNLTVGSSGKINADGGAGGNGGRGGGDNSSNSNGAGGGGGGGGNGGAIVLLYNNINNNGSITANGGAKGTGGPAGTNGGSGGTGTAGSDGTVGNSGQVWQFTP